MKYNLNINQAQAKKLNIKNITQLLILDVLSVCSLWCKMETFNNESYYWVARQKIIEELEILDLKPNTVYKHLKTLKESDFIKYEKKGKKDLVKLTKKGKSLFISTMSEKNPSYYVGKKSEKDEKNSDLNPTYNNTKEIIIHDNKEKVKKEKDFEEIKDFEELFDFWEKNKKGGKYKNKSKNMVLKKLKKLTNNDIEYARRVIENSIINGYQGFCKGNDLFLNNNSSTIKKKRRRVL